MSDNPYTLPLSQVIAYIFGQYLAIIDSEQNFRSATSIFCTYFPHNFKINLIIGLFISDNYSQLVVVL